MYWYNTQNKTQLCAERGFSHRKRLEKNALSVKTKSRAGTSKVTEKSSQAADAFDANEKNISCMLTSIKHKYLTQSLNISNLFCACGGVNSMESLFT